MSRCRCFLSYYIFESPLGSIFLHSILLSCSTLDFKNSLHTRKNFLKMHRSLTTEKPRPVVIANWKTNGTRPSIQDLLSSWSAYTPSHAVECYLAPSLLHIPHVQHHLKSILSYLHVAAQNCVAKSGAFTGEVSVQQLKEMGVRTVILGHSERRAYYSETDRVVAEKISAVLREGCTVVVCIGERLTEREAGETTDVITRQLRAVITAVGRELWGQVIIAYEPVWAIGTGRVATPAQAQDAHRTIRNIIAESVSVEVAQKVRILYGGSVAPGNARQLYAQPDINGFLVGGASLRPNFVEIIQSTSSVEAIPSKL